ncbi:G-protein coupled receptors family 1 profile domain-containing protein [Caenorhabditis elegans]|uniref:G-protein coupled receptors family 1 profile domain-containing protein n=1 Tax=Caenorhabditis elegans TaxID=6239 RepID=Q9U2P2_CAEEL|nr:G-protein coupled receptors family 1 profile domain-containing protein [Caenorhabditis elegans]CAA19493.2 G-protein coupled receptors family 1 profile domain-containing protein [Caenorhabditis elegans]|eukprot:NP_502686.2 Serpentine Receptor, class W [Caenorhabditis elegans]
MNWTFSEYYVNEDSHPDNAKFQELAIQLDKLLIFSNPFTFIFSCFGFLINIFHLITITRKSLRANSVYVLMIGITSSDLYTMFHINYVYIDTIISTYLHNKMYEGYKCWYISRVTHGYFHVLCELLMRALGDILRRLSTWLALFMALFRFLIIQFSMNAKFNFVSTPKFALKTIIATFLISFLLTLFAYIGQYRVVEDGLQASLYCEEPLDFEVPHTYIVGNSRIFDDYWPVVVKYSLMSEGITKIIPAVTLPFLTIGLIKCLHEASRARQKLNSPHKNASNDKSVKMVAIMTIFSMIAESPSGIIHTYQFFYYDYSSIITCVKSLDKLFINLSILNAIVHCVISFRVSTQYREVAKKLFSFKNIRRTEAIAIKNSIHAVETFTSFGKSSSTKFVIE